MLAGWMRVAARTIGPPVEFPSFGPATHPAKNMKIRMPLIAACLDLNGTLLLLKENSRTHFSHTPR
jgi:hypothetical protein